ncbi:MAG TPA: GDSL-type esterase/lipase family protein [Acidimicrobiales bacterium]|nr:GDSL-type esterase/lipase family protein [Acidimicrobiales bacterium]
MSGAPKWVRSMGGKLVRLVLPGVRQVHAQVAPYAKAWDAANATALSGKGPLWVVLGDSTAQGIGAPAHDQGYVGQLRAALDEHSSTPWRVLNLSRSGARAADVVETQLPRLEAIEPPPQLVTCAIGANDMIPTPLDQVITSIREIMRRLPEGAVMATIPQGLRPPHAIAVNDVIRSEGPAAGLVVADVWAHTGPPWQRKLAADGFHPGLTGYANWAKAFAEALAAAPGPWAGIA